MASKTPWRLLSWLGILVFLGVFFFYPLARILFLSLDFSALTAGNLRLIGSVLWFSIYQALLSTFLTLAVGFPAAFLFARYDFRGRGFLRLLMAIPFMLPTVVVAAGFNAWLGPRGWLNLALMSLFNLKSPPVPFVGTLTAILLAHVFYNTVIVVRVVGNALAHFDERLEQAARSLGADRRSVFTQVILPLLLPAISSAAILVFLFDFTSFGIILLLGDPRFSTLEVEIYYQAVRFFNLPLAAWLSLIQLAFTLFFSIIYSRIVIRNFAQISPRPAVSNLQRIRSGSQRALISGMVFLLLIFYSLPLVSLPIRSVTRLEADLGDRGMVQPGLTTTYYSELFMNRSGSLFYVPPVSALGNSLGYAALTVVLSLALGFPAAAALARPGRLERLLDPVLMLPLGASAVTLGLGFILSFGRLMTSPWVVPLAHTMIALPFVIRSLQPALASIPERLRMAAASLGAGPIQVWLAVDWPIIRRAAMAAAAFAFTISLGEFGAASLVARPDHPTLPVAISRFLSQPGAMNYGQAMAMATMLMLASIIGILVIEKLRLPASAEF